MGRRSLFGGFDNKRKNALRAIRKKSKTSKPRLPTEKKERISAFRPGPKPEKNAGYSTSIPQSFASWSVSC